MLWAVPGHIHTTFRLPKELRQKIPFPPSPRHRVGDPIVGCQGRKSSDLCRYCERQLHWDTPLEGRVRLQRWVRLESYDFCVYSLLINFKHLGHRKCRRSMWLHLNNDLERQHSDLHCTFADQLRISPQQPSQHSQPKIMLLCFRLRVEHVLPPMPARLHERRLL